MCLTYWPPVNQNNVFPRLFKNWVLPKNDVKIHLFSLLCMRKKILIYFVVFFAQSSRPVTAFSFLFLTEDCLCLFRRWMGWPRASETGCFSHSYAQLHHAELDRCQTGLASVGPKNETRRQRHGVVDIDTIKSVVGEKRLDKLRTKGGRKMIWSAPPM